MLTAAPTVISILMTRISTKDDAVDKNETSNQNKPETNPLSFTIAT